MQQAVYLQALGIDLWARREQILPPTFLVIICQEDQARLNDVRALLSRILAYLEVDEAHVTIIGENALPNDFPQNAEAISHVLCFGCPAPSEFFKAVATESLIAMEQHPALKKKVFHDIQPLRN